MATTYNYANGGFPTSPSVEETLLMNGCVYVYTSKGSWEIQEGVGGGGVNITSSATNPTSPSVGDQWFDTSTGILSAYMTDGTDSDWIDISSANGLAASSGGGGAMVFISKNTITANTSYSDFTGISGYTRYILQVDELLGSIGGADLGLQMMVNGTPHTSAYRYELRQSADGIWGTFLSTFGSYIQILESTSTTSNNESAATVNISSLHGTVRTTAHGVGVSFDNATGRYGPIVFSGADYSNSTACNGLRLLMSTGSIKKGIFTLYGIKDS